MQSKEKIKYLSRYRAAVARESDIMLEIEMLRSRAEKITASWDGMPKGGGLADAISIAVEATDKERERLAIECTESCKLREGICDAIASVPDATLRRVLYLRYVLGYTWEHIAVEMNYTYKWVCSLHGKALQDIKIAKST